MFHRRQRADLQRPAAVEQLKVLGEQVGVPVYTEPLDSDPVKVCRNALKLAKKTGEADVLILDTAGRLHIDDELMQQLEQIDRRVEPQQVYFVCDAMTGQDAVNVAKSFADRVGLTGIVLSRIDGDARGGAALSMRAVTGQPIKFVGTGEKIDDLEAFHPTRIAGRILGMGDVVSLVERAAETIDAEKANRIAAKMRKGAFDLDDLSAQLAQMGKLGGMSGVLAMLPGIGGMKKQLKNANIDDGLLKRQMAIISSMTKAERRHPKILNASRKRRVAKGSGTSVQEINRLVKMHRQMADMMKKVGRKGGLKGMFGAGAPAPEDMAQSLGPGGLPPMGPGGLPGLPGRPGGFSGLPGLPGRKK